MTIEISRKDIVCDKILELPVATRFLKLPVTPYLDLLGITPSRPQIAIVNAVNNPKYRFIVAAIARRIGKTYIANIVGQLVALIPKSTVLIISPNYRLSEISFELQRTLIRHFDLEVLKDNAKDKIIELANGSLILMGSINKVDSVVGRSYDFIIFDEAALAEGKEAFNVALRPTLDKPGSKALFISTPRGRSSWFAEFFERGYSEDFKEWISIKADYRENPRMSLDDINEARNSMSLSEFKQEYEADFNVYEGQIWNFDFETCVEDLSELDLSKMDIFGGLDVGFNDPTAFCVIGYDWDLKKFFLLVEYYGGGKTTAKHAEAIQILIEKYDIDYIYIDAAAAQTRWDLAQEHDISTIMAKKSVNDGIAHVGAIIDNKNLIVHVECVETLLALDQYQWNPNPNLIKEKPLHNKASNMADAIRYALYSFQTTMTGF